MSGLTGTPWGRQAIYAIPDEEREAIEDAIPSGVSITVAAEIKPGTWSVRIFRDGQQMGIVKPAYSVPAACWRLLEQVREKAS